LFSLSLFKIFKGIYNVQIDTIETSMENAAQIAVFGTTNEVLPLGIPIPHFVVAIPVGVALGEPYGPVMVPLRLPIITVIFRLPDGQVADDQPLATIRLLLQMLNFFCGEGRSIVKKQIHDDQIVIGGRDSMYEVGATVIPFRVDDV
jgi:hypothetical protein